MEISKKSNVRIKADRAKKNRCKNLIAVIENPSNIINVGSVIRNVETLGVEKTYIVDKNNVLRGSEWEQFKKNKYLLKLSASASKWSFIKKFKTTEECFAHLEKKNFISLVTSPHIKGKDNILLENGDFTQKKLAVWFGNEAHGISDLAVQRSSGCINIFMTGIVESLNLGVASGIVFMKSRNREEIL